MDGLLRQVERLLWDWYPIWCWAGPIYFQWTVQNSPSQNGWIRPFEHILPSFCMLKPSCPGGYPGVVSLDVEKICHHFGSDLFPVGDQWLVPWLSWNRGVIHFHGFFLMGFSIRNHPAMERLSSPFFPWEFPVIRLEDPAMILEEPWFSIQRARSLGFAPWLWTPWTRLRRSSARHGQTIVVEGSYEEDPAMFVLSGRGSMGGTSTGTAGGSSEQKSMVCGADFPNKTNPLMVAESGEQSERWERIRV